MKEFKDIEKSEQRNKLIPKGNLRFTLEQFDPVQVLEGRIPVYAAKSFKGRILSGAITTPTIPSILVMNDVEIINQYRGTSSHYQMNILYCHGTSTQGSWTLRDDRTVTIMDLLRSIERTSINIDFIYVCNPGNYVLSQQDFLRRAYKYALGKPSGTPFYGEDDGLTVHITCPRLMIYSP
jgi:hypothetical protein